jgi:hypothetical protein
LLLPPPTGLSLALPFCAAMALILVAEKKAGKSRLVVG